MQIYTLNGNEEDTERLPDQWQVFAQRWTGWRQQFRRDHWPASWQGVAYRKKQLVFPSPWHDDGWIPTRLSIRRGLAFAYLLRQERHQALLLPGYLGAGHELEALVLIKERILLHYPCSLADAEWFEALAKLFLQALDGWIWPDPNDGRRPLQLRLEGHPNFAHQLLNGYTAIASAIGHGEMDALPLQLVGIAPFAPLEKLFPEVLWKSPLVSSEPLGACFELPISQRPDGIPPSLRQRLRDCCRTELGSVGRQVIDQLHSWREGGGWVLWVSVKSRIASAEGLSELVLRWMEELRKRGDILPLLFIDGFSLQSGMSREEKIHGIAVEQWIGEEEQQARDLAEKIQERKLGLPVVMGVGLPLHDSILIAEHVDFYVCHQGTVQHKIGWTQDGIPGVVHSNSCRNAGGDHRWGSMGVGDAPKWFPATFCEDLGEGPRGSYRFTDQWQADGARWLSDQVERSVPACSLDKASTRSRSRRKR